MAFVKRDADGKITAASLQATEEAGEELPLDDPELSQFLQETCLNTRPSATGSNRTLAWRG